MTDVEEGGPTRLPGHRGVTAAIDRPVYDLSGLDVQDVQLGLFGPAPGYLVAQQPAVHVGLPGIECGETGGIDRHWVDEGLLGPIRPGDVQDRMLLPGGSAQEEPPVSTPHRR